MTNKFKLTKKREKWASEKKEAPTFKGAPLTYNAAIQSRYVNDLNKLLSEMIKKTERDVELLFKSEAGEAHFAQDASIASQSRILMSALSSRFEALFNKKAKPIAERMVNDTDKASTTALHSSLKEMSGEMSLKTSTASAAFKEIKKSHIDGNVGLIKSIPQEYLKRVSGALMQSITTGNGLATLIPALKKISDQSERSVKNLALDQTRKAYSSMNETRLQGLGVEQFMWNHSGGGAHPRPDHVAMDGKIFKFSDPPVIDKNTGERGLPGQAINCRCFMTPVFKFEGD